MAQAGFEAGSWVWVGYTQRSRVILSILHRYPAAVELGIGEGGGTIKYERESWSEDYHRKEQGGRVPAGEEGSRACAASV